MDRIAQFRRVITDPSAAPLAGDHPLDGLLRHLVVHLSFADGEVDETEFALLGRLMPGLGTGEILEAVVALSEAQLDVGRLEIEVPAPTDRRRLLRLAEEIVALDGSVTAGEHRLIAALRQELA